MPLGDIFKPDQQALILRILPNLHFIPAVKYRGVTFHLNISGNSSLSSLIYPAMRFKINNLFNMGNTAFIKLLFGTTGRQQNSALLIHHKGRIVPASRKGKEHLRKTVLILYIRFRKGLHKNRYNIGYRRGEDRGPLQKMYQHAVAGGNNIIGRQHKLFSQKNRITAETFGAAMVPTHSM